MFVWGARVYLNAYSPANDAMRIYGVGKQWMWKFQHPNGQREINTLHVPRGRPVQLMMISQDVIHSFFVPEFRVHMDLLAQPIYLDEFHGHAAWANITLFCSQYCGTNHSGMRGR